MGFWRTDGILGNDCEEGNDMGVSRLFFSLIPHYYGSFFSVFRSLLLHNMRVNILSITKINVDKMRAIIYVRYSIV